MQTTQRHTVTVVELAFPSVNLSLSLYFQPFNHETSGVPGWLGGWGRCAGRGSPHSSAALHPPGASRKMQLGSENRLYLMSVKV